jgi:hypothetical protein
MPEENLVQHPTTVTATPGDELSTEEWLKQRNAPPAPSEPESKTAEATEPSQQEQERDDKGQFKENVPPGVQKRIDKAIAKQREAERRAEEAERRLQETSQVAKPAAVEQPKAAESELKAPVKPELKDFADWDKYEEAKDKWTIEYAEFTAKSAVAADRKARTEAEARAKAEEQNKAVASEWDKSVEAARESHEDYDEKIDQAKEDIKAGKLKPANNTVLGAIVASDAKAELLYHLLSNPEELEQLNSLPQHMVGYALGKIEAKITSAKPSKPAPEKTVKPNPKPPEPVTGKASASSGPSEEDSTEEWLRKRNAQVRAKGKPY